MKNTSLFAGAIILSACAAQVVDGETAQPVEAAASEQAILSGTPTNNGVTVKVLNPDAACTGTLVRNNVVLTAAHCVMRNCSGDCGLRPDGQGYAPADVDVVQQPPGSLNDVEYPGAEIIWPGTNPNSPDVALIRTNGFFAVNGSTLGHSISLRGGVTNDQVGKTHRCWGFGRTTCQDGVANGMTRMDIVPTDEIWIDEPGGTFYSSKLYYDPNSSGQIANKGDSGMSCREKLSYGTDLTEWPIVTVASVANRENGCPIDNGNTKVDSFRDWAHDAFGDWTSNVNLNFTNGIAGFTFYNPNPMSGGTPEWFPQGGWMRELSNAHGTAANAPGAHAIYTATAISNATLEVKVWSTDNDAAGLIGRWRDECNYYRFAVDQEEGLATITRFRNCTGTVLADEPISIDWDGAPGTGRVLKFVLNENSLVGYVDGVQVVSDSDSSVLTAGKAGIYKWALANSWFDDFKVTPID